MRQNGRCCTSRIPKIDFTQDFCIRKIMKFPQFLILVFFEKVEPYYGIFYLVNNSKYYKGSFGLNWKVGHIWPQKSIRRLRPLRRAYWLAHDVFQVEKKFSRIRRSFCAQIICQIWSNFWCKIQKTSTLRHQSLLADPFHFSGPIG